MNYKKRMNYNISYERNKKNQGFTFSLSLALSLSLSLFLSRKYMFWKSHKAGTILEQFGHWFICAHVIWAPKLMVCLEQC